MATLTTLSSTTRFAIASGQGHIATEQVWLICDYSAYGCEPKPTPPVLAAAISTAGSGVANYGKAPGIPDNDGYYREFAWDFPADTTGASAHMAHDILTSFTAGGPVSVLTLDPYTDDPSQQGRTFMYHIYDADMEAPRASAIIPNIGAFVTQIQFKAATRRTY